MISVELYRAQLEGRPSDLAELEIQYGDFAAWQREWFVGERLDSQLSHWKRVLDGAPNLLELPTDRARPAHQLDRGGRVRALFPPELAERLDALSREEGATLFMTLLAAFATLLSRYSDQNDMVIGTPVANRQRVELEPLIGFFANTLALRIDLSEDPTFRTAQRRVRTCVLDALAHQDLPFEQLVAELNPARSLSHTPLFQVLFQLQLPDADETAGYQLPGVEVTRVDVDRGKSKFDLALTMRSGADGLHASLEYSAELFDHETAKRMLGHLRNLLLGVAEDADRAVSQLPLLNDDEQDQLARWNRTRTAYPDGERCVHELVELQVERSPDAAAVSFRGEELSYNELNARADQLALRLAELGVGPDVSVAISMNRSPELVIAVLGVLKAGGAYTPLDPSYPQERIRFMLHETGPPVLLTTAQMARGLPDSPARVLLVDDEMTVDRRGGLVGSSPDNLAYVLFTSGSTGWPKGVAMPHRSLSNLLLWQKEHFHARPDARTLQFASLNFDVAFQEIFSTLTSGGTLVLVDDETRRDAEALLRFLDSEAIERLFLPFAALQHLAETAVERGHHLDSLREVITAGEALQASIAIRRFFAGLQDCVLQNQYGPTESHVATAYTLARDSAVWPDAPPIGAPIANTHIRILDRYGAQVPVGVPGQLHIGGTPLARGYLNQPDLTSERFVADPFGGSGDRLYRTGDLARYQRDGNLEFLGRIDDQVKVRGYRVELGEIESVLLRHEGLREAAAVVREDVGGEGLLVGYVVPTETPGPTASELRAFLGSYLPEFMVPSAFVIVEALPLGATGKIDRRALPAPDRRQAVQVELVAPRNETERALAAIWQNVLGITAPIGVTDDFFALGGHSLLAVRLLAKVERVLRVKLPLATLFEDSTVERMAARISELAHGDRRLPTLTPLKSSGSKPPLFLLHGRDGELMFYKDLVGALSADQPAYGIQPVGFDGKELPFLSVQEMAAHYVKELRAFAPDGPYLLAGYCFSGVLAYEVAHQLTEEGRAPALLALIDAPPFGHKRRPGRAELERAKLAQFREANVAGKLRWIKRRAKGVTYKVRTRVMFAFYDHARRGGGWIPHSVVSVEGAILSALRTYKTPSSTLRVTLFRAFDPTTQTFSSASRWTPLAQDVEIRPIVAPGIQHDNVVREPYVRLLSRELEAAIGESLAAQEPVAQD